MMPIGLHGRVMAAQPGLTRATQLMQGVLARLQVSQAAGAHSGAAERWSTVHHVVTCCHVVVYQGCLHSPLQSARKSVPL